MKRKLIPGTNGPYPGSQEPSLKNQFNVILQPTSTLPNGFLPSGLQTKILLALLISLLFYHSLFGSFNIC